MKKSFGWLKGLVCILPFLTIGMLIILKDGIYHVSAILPKCPIYYHFGIYCPGCGNTRSIQHLLQGDVVGSLSFNIAPIVGIIIAALAYLELITFVFGKHIKLIPRDRKFWTFIIIAFSLYFIIRNVIR